MNAIAEKAPFQILCIEDDAGLLRLMQKRLERSGYQTIPCSSASEASTLLSETEFDAVVVDFWLPDDNGLAVLKLISNMEVSPPVIMVTGQSDVEIAVEAMKLGAADFLSKDMEGEYLNLLPTLLDKVIRQCQRDREHEEAQALANVTLGSIADAVITTTTDGSVHFLNPAAEEMLGTLCETALDRPVAEIFRIADDNESLESAALVAKVIANRDVVAMQTHLQISGTSEYRLPVSVSISPIEDSSGHILGCVIIFQDISAQKEYEAGLRLFEKLFQCTSEGIVVTDSQTRIIDVNRAFTDITGFSRDEVLGENPNIMQSGRHDESFFQDMWRSISTDGQWQGEIWDRRKNGEIYPKWLSINAVAGGAGEEDKYVGIFSDISLIKRTEERLHRMAHYDALTNLPNRTLFQDRLEQSIRQAERKENMAALMFIDLDRFKLVNDTYGHQAGDQLLVEVARRLEQQVRRSDTVARLGGDEFTIIISDVERIDAVAQVAQKIIEVLAEPVMLNGDPIYTSPSIGIAIFPLAGFDADAITKAADMAMYRAKEAGRNNYQFYRHDVNDMSHSFLHLQSEMRQGIDDGDFYLCYQPQLDVATGKVMAVEALLRWCHPQRGVLLPKEFIAIAEETGFIVELGAWVLEQACLEAKRWHVMGFNDLRIAVNVSAVQLNRDDFVDTVEAILTRTGLPGSMLELELTESSVMHRLEEKENLLHQLRELGITISIDDFGTGYSSLSYLNKFTVDVLKIDQSFIENVTSKAEDAAISQGIIALAQGLGIRVVAEGVETEAQRDFLTNVQCGNMQGYLFSHPLIADDIVTYLQNRKTVKPPN